MDFCKQFNAATADKKGQKRAGFLITVYSDRTFDFVVKTPPVSELIRKKVGLAKGAKNPGSEVAGKISQKDVEEIAKIKMVDLSAYNLAAASKIVAGSARSMGLEVEWEDNNSKIGKKHRAAKEAVAFEAPVALQDGLKAVVDSAHVKFDESVDVDVILGIDAAKGEQQVRGALVLPHGLGKKIRVIVFAKGEHEEAATKAGADFVGGDDLVEKIQGGWLDFDAAVATPDMMGVVGKVARILGPRGLLPNKKVGTVTFDVAQVVGELKKGRVSYRNDKIASSSRTALAVFHLV